MINPNIIKDAVLNILASSEGQLDLTKDSVTINYTYPDMPDILVTLTIGGLFYSEGDDDLLH